METQTKYTAVQQELSQRYMEQAENARLLSDVFERDSRRYSNTLKEEEEVQAL
ncbi:MAG TPA: hypothetical protein IAD32_08000 [Candidatus Scatavimonas merdigallinarum]|uniref:Uncharacterized protein n=1 Tax=Candidatus Scatavimonas merdigallinarum TaxID=2840914 RepID=A0A9D0ZIW6_9FIRM|nr:hypothetical protein [Candidatus Scatavimonas merdigallinarum]